MDQEVIPAITGLSGLYVTTNISETRSYTVTCVKGPPGTEKCERPRSSSRTRPSSPAIRAPTHLYEAGPGFAGAPREGDSTGFRQTSFPINAGCSRTATIGWPWYDASVIEQYFGAIAAGGGM